MLERTVQGPLRVADLRPGDPYELSRGHPIECMPTGGRGSRANRLGAQVLGTDPAVESVGVDTGFALADDNLRAPDVAVGNIPDRPVWVQAVPPLAVEYADTGQDEADLRQKFAELLAAGTRWVWVVRLTGPRVEIHTRGADMVKVLPGGLLQAPGVLANPVPVEALYDEAAANDATLRNLLQRQGYTSLEQVRTQGQAEGRVEGALTSLKESLVQIAAARNLALSDPQRQRIMDCTELALLKHWLRQAALAQTAAEIFG